MPLPVLTDQQIADVLTRTGNSWYGDNGFTEIKFAFPANLGSYWWPQVTTETGLDSVQQDWVRTTFSVLSDLFDLTFVEVAPPANTSANPPVDIIQFVNDAGGGTFSASYNYTGTTLIALNAVVLDSTWSENQSANLSYGSRGFFVMIHEILHSLGLSHPGNYDASDGGPITYQNNAEFAQDTVRYTVMSYFEAFEDQSGAAHFMDVNGTYQVVYARTPMVYDILAMTSGAFNNSFAGYGFNATTRNGNTTYGYNASVDAGEIHDFAAHGSPVLTIYDTGGIDTLDLSGDTVAVRFVVGFNASGVANSLTTVARTTTLIDLREGQYSSTHGMTYNIGIAFGTVIENAIGTQFNDTIIGNNVANRLDGRLGADTMIGGLGDDIYMVDDAGDVTTELAGQGFDRVFATVSYTLAANVEQIALLGAASINATGNNDNNVLIGNGNNNTLNGRGGADRMFGGDGDDIYIVDNIGDLVVENTGAGSGYDQVSSFISYTLTANVERLNLAGSANINGTGNDLANFLVGNSGNNTLNGMTGVDTMVGLDGDDIYIIDDVGDVAVEQAGHGYDRLFSSVSFQIGANIEQLALLGTANINGTGNASDNVLIGNAGDNTLNGLGGADRMFGGIGNDIYIVDNAGDLVVENANQGYDQVSSFITYTLTANVERLNLLGTADLNGTGNGLDNHLFGNAGNNTLNGMAGADTMVGFDGDDIYFVDNPNDIVIEQFNQGYDRVYSSVSLVLSNNVEQLVLVGTSQLSGYGNNGNNIIIGNSGNNLIDGGRGSDVLFGGAGADEFQFYFAPAPNNIDTIGDFVSGTDRIGIWASAFTGMTSGITADQFRSGAGLTAAVDADDRFIYDSTTGNLYYDADGVGGAGAIRFAVLSGAPTLAHTDFVFYNNLIA